MTRRRVAAARVALLFTLAASTTGLADVRPARADAIARALAPRQSHTYPVALNAGDVLRVDVTQDDLDVVVGLTDPEGRERISIDARQEEVFPETLVAIVDEAGTYAIRVSPAPSARLAGRYAIHIAPPHPASAADRRLADAERTYVDGVSMLDRTRAAGWPMALERLRAARAAYTEANDRRGEMKALFAIARAQYYLHDAADLQTARECERIARELGDRPVLARMLMGIGNMLVYRGDVAASVAPFTDAIAIARATGSSRAEMRTLNDAALAWERLGDAEDAAKMLERALVLARRTRETQMEANLLTNLGTTYRQLGDADRALSMYEQALANRRAADDPRGQTLILNSLGNLKNTRGRLQEAMAYHQQALALARRIGWKQEEARALGNLGNDELALKRPEQALEHEQASLALRDAIGDVSGQGFSLARTGRILQQLGRYEEAAAALERSLAIRRQIHERYNEADTLFDLAALERDRGGFGAAIDYAAAAANLDEQLRRRIDSPDLRVAFRAQGQRTYELLIDLLQRHPAESAGAAAASLDVSERARARVLLESVVESRIDRDRYETLPPAEPLTTTDIQTGVVDSRTVLLEFELGEARSWLWTVTPTEVASYELPPRRTIESAARRVYAQLATPGSAGPASSATLSRMLLGSIGVRLRGDWRGKRLAIVPSGALGSVPFAALPVPGGTASSDPLSAHHEIVMVPSASVVAALRAEAARRPRAAGAVAIVADPVFDPSDPRVAVTRPRPASVVTRGAPTWPRLPFSRAEADAIAAFAPAASVLKATSFQANRASLLAGALNNYRIVHIATHGVVDTDRPAMSALVMSLVDKSGRPQDGYIRQRDIYGMRLDADLVVLSACRTAIGKEVHGEGLMGLTRAFMYAGTPRVVASLWEVGDRATAVFMEIFYRNLLQQRLAPAAALRAAQNEMARSPRWSAPYYWAGFVLHGDWR